VGPVIIVTMSEVIVVGAIAEVVAA
jgi:hypothetical protein